MVYAALKRLTKHSLIYALGPAVQKAIGFVLIPFITYWVGTTAGYGRLELGSVTIAIAAQVLGVNLLYGMTRFHAEYDDPKDRAKLVSTTLILLVASMGAAFVVAWFARAPAAELLFGSREHDKAIVVVFAILFFQTIGLVGLRWLQILERSITYGVLTTVKLLLEIGLKVWLLLLGLKEMGAFYSTLGGEALIATGLFVYIAWKLGLSFSWPMAKRLWRYSAPLIVSGLCGFILHQSDRFFVLRMQNAGDVGLYGLAYKLGTIGNVLFLEAFGLIWFPYVFGIKSEDEVRELVRRVLTYFNLLMCVASVALAVFSREIVELMSTSEFHEAWRAMPIIVAAYVMWALVQVLHTVFFLRERTGLISLLYAIAAGVNVALNFLLVPQHGYLGAAWATAGTFAVLAVVSWIVAERVMPIAYETARVVGPIALGLALYLMSLAIPDWTAPAVIAVKLALVLAFPIALVGAGFLRPEEKSKIKEIWHSVRSGSRPK
jgi:O-antigen/teichoic acid export membrane protein